MTESTDGAAEEERNRLEAAFIAGAQLDGDAVARLEQQLAIDGDDLEIRARLLGFYRAPSSAAAGDPREARREHIAWIIDNRPASHLASLIAMLCVFDVELGREVVAAWVTRLRAIRYDDLVAGLASVHAAECAMHVDEDQALTWLAEARQRALDRDTRLRIDRLELEMLRRPLTDRGAAERLARMEAIADGKEVRSHALERMAALALEIEDLDKASRYAEELLATAALAEDWRAGNAHFRGHWVLGRVALRRGDVASAKLHLALSARTEGSPQLNSFGPNMLLAKELLERGEKSAVLHFFRSCARFWQLGADRLQSWSEDVRAGRQPDFGANLRY
jgi:hypothetical protein